MQVATATENAGIRLGRKARGITREPIDRQAKKTTKSTILKNLPARKPSSWISRHAHVNRILNFVWPQKSGKVGKRMLVAANLPHIQEKVPGISLGSLNQEKGAAIGFLTPSDSLEYAGQILKAANADNSVPKELIKDLSQAKHLIKKSESIQRNCRLNRRCRKWDYRDFLLERRDVHQQRIHELSHTPFLGGALFVVGVIEQASIPPRIYRHKRSIAKIEKYLLEDTIRFYKKIEGARIEEQVRHFHAWTELVDKLISLSLKNTALLKDFKEFAPQILKTHWKERAQTVKSWPSIYKRLAKHEKAVPGVKALLKSLHEELKAHPFSSSSYSQLLEHSYSQNLQEKWKKKSYEDLLLVEDFSGKYALLKLTVLQCMLEKKLKNHWIGDLARAKDKDARALRKNAQRFEDLINDVDVGKTCLLPLFSNYKKDRWFLLHITKQDADHVDIALMDGSQLNVEWVHSMSAGGKDKHERVLRYESVPVKTLQKNFWLKVGEHEIPQFHQDFAQTAEGLASKTSGLMPFLMRQWSPYRLEKAETKSEAYGKQKESTSLRALELFYRTEHKSGLSGDRAKLRMRLATLFYFYSQIRHDLVNQSTHQKLLDMGIYNCRRMAHKYFLEKKISREDLASVEKELNVIEATLSVSRKEEDEVDPLASIQAKGYDYDFEKIRPESLSILKSKVEAPEVEKRSALKAESLKKELRKRHLVKGQFDHLTSLGITRTLEKVIKDCMSLYKGRKYKEAGHMAADALRDLPFDPWKKRALDEWCDLPLEHCESASRGLSRLQQILFDCNLKTKRMPEYDLLIMKSICIQDYLARRNHKKTQYKSYCLNPLRDQIKRFKACLDSDGGDLSCPESLAWTQLDRKLVHNMYRYLQRYSVFKKSKPFWPKGIDPLQNEILEKFLPRPKRFQELKKGIGFTHKEWEKYSDRLASFAYLFKDDDRLPSQLHDLKIGQMFLKPLGSLACSGAEHWCRLPYEVLNKPILNDLGEYSLKRWTLRGRVHWPVFTRGNITYVIPYDEDLRENCLGVHDKSIHSWQWFKAKGVRWLDPDSVKILFDRRIQRGEDSSFSHQRFEYMLRHAFKEIVLNQGKMDPRDRPYLNHIIYPYEFELLDPDDLQEILRCMAGEKGMIEQWMGIMTARRYFLENTRVRHLMELLCFRPNLLKASVERNPRLLHNVMLPFFKTNYELCEVSKEWKGMAAITRMAVQCSRILHEIRSENPEWKSFDKDLEAIKRWERRLIDLSENKSRELLQSQRGLWALRILPYLKQSKYSGSDLVKIYQGLFHIEQLPADEDGVFPLMEEQISLLQRRCMPLLKKAMENKEFKYSLLDTLVKFLEPKKSRYQWKGTFPEFHNEKFKINIDKKRLATFDGGRPTFVEPGLLGHPFVSFVAAGKVHYDIQAYEVSSSSGPLIRFEGIGGRKTYVRGGGFSTQVFQEISTHGKKGLYQIIDRRALLPSVSDDANNPMDIILGDFTESGKENLKRSPLRAVESITSKFIDTFVLEKKYTPAFLTEPGVTFWHNTEKPYDVVMMDEKGNLLRRLYFKRGWNKCRLVDMEDLRLDKPDRRVLVSLERTKHPLVQQILRFEDPRYILAWREGEKLKEISLPRFELSFVYSDEKWKVRGPAVLNEGGEHYLVDGMDRKETLGLNAVLLLENKKGKRRVLLPRLELTPVESLVQEYFLDHPVEWVMTMLRTGRALAAEYFQLIHKDYWHKVIQLRDWAKVMSPKLRQKTQKKQFFEVFDVNQDTKLWHHVGGSEREYTDEGIPLFKRDHNSALLHLATHAMVDGKPEQALVFVEQLKGSLSKEALSHLLTLAQWEKIHLLAGPNDKAVGFQIYLRNYLRFLHSPEKGNYCDRDLGKQYLDYLSYQGKVRVELRLTPEQHETCLGYLAKDEPEFWQKHGEDLKRFVNQEYTDKNSPKALSAEFVRHLKGNESESTRFAREFFRYLKDASGSKKLSSEDLIKRLEPELGQEASESLFSQSLQNYLKHALEFDLSTELRQDVGELANKETLSKKELESFFSSLDQSIAEQKGKVARPNGPFATASSRDLMHKRLEKKMEGDLKALYQQALSRSFENIDYPSVEAMEAGIAKSAQIPRIHEPVAGVCKELYEARVLSDMQMKKHFFWEQRNHTYQRTKEHFLPALEALAEEDSRLCQRCADLKKSTELFLEEEMSKNDWVIKKVRDYKPLERLLKERKEGFSNTAKEFKDKIDKACRLRVKPVLKKAQKKAGYLYEVEFSELLKAYFQGDLESLAVHLPKGTDFQILNRWMTSYLIYRTQEQRVDRALKNLQVIREVQEARSDPDGRGRMAEVSLAENLAQERSYDPWKQKDLLIFEYFAELIIRPHQIPVIDSLVEHLDTAKQAVTGIGKTSVILLLVAMMRAKPGVLSILYFPKSLYKDNSRDLEHKLGTFYQRHVYSLEYPPRKEEQDLLVFRRIYDNLLRSSTERSVVTSTRENVQALQSKFKSMVRMLDEGALEDKNALHVLAKILLLLRRHGVQLTDEVDRVLEVRDQYLRSTETNEKVPRFKWAATFAVYEHLVRKHPELRLLKNGQGDLFDEERAEILEKVRKEFAERWVKEKRIQEDDVSVCLDYLRGVNDEFLDRESLKAWPGREKDELVIIQEQLSRTLKLTLSRKGGLTYGRSQIAPEKNSREAAKVKPYYLGEPRETARHGNDLEVLNYTCQDYLSKGVSFHHFSQWMRSMLRHAKLQAETQAVPLSETSSGKDFRRYLANAKDKNLRDIGFWLSEKSWPRLHRLFNKCRSAKFLYLKNVVLPEVTRTPLSTRDDACNFLSMHKHNSGASATLTGLVGLEKELNLAQARDSQAEGRMSALFMDRGQYTTETYDPFDPWCVQKMLSQGAKAGRRAHVDGAGVACDEDSFSLARFFLSRCPEEIKGVVYWRGGVKRVLLRGATEDWSPESAKLKPEQVALICDYARSRGADQALALNAQGQITVDNKLSFEDILQENGRMRLLHEEQGTAVWVPEKLHLKDKKEVIIAGLKRTADLVADNRVRRAKQRMRDAVHEGMMTSLLLFAEKKDFDGARACFNRIKNTGVLDSAEEEDYEAGSYFKMFSRLDYLEDTDLALEQVRNKYIRMWKKTGMDLVHRGLGVEKDPLDVLGAIEWKEHSNEMPQKVSVSPITHDDSEMETNVEKEMQQEQEAEKEQENVRDLLFERRPVDEKDWAPWEIEEGMKPVESLVSSIQKGVMPGKDPVVFQPISALSHILDAGAHVSSNVCSDLKKSFLRVEEQERFVALNVLKPVRQLLVVKGAGLWVCGLDPLDNEHLHRLLELDRQEGGEQDTHQAYIYDLRLRKVVATGANAGGLPAKGLPKELKRVELQYRLLNFEAHYSLEQQKELFSMFRDWHDQGEFEEFKKFFEFQFVAQSAKAFRDYEGSALQEVFSIAKRYFEGEENFSPSEECLLKTWLG